jgi:hypothetical protein
MNAHHRQKDWIGGRYFNSRYVGNPFGHSDVSGISFHALLDRSPYRCMHCSKLFVGLTAICHFNPPSGTRASRIVPTDDESTEPSAPSVVVNHAAIGGQADIWRMSNHPILERRAVCIDRKKNPHAHVRATF